MNILSRGENDLRAISNNTSTPDRSRRELETNEVDKYNYQHQEKAGPGATRGGEKERKGGSAWP